MTGRISDVEEAHNDTDIDVNYAHIYGDIILYCCINARLWVPHREGLLATTSTTKVNEHQTFVYTVNVDKVVGRFSAMRTLVSTSVLPCGLQLPFSDPASAARVSSLPVHSH